MAAESVKIPGGWFEEFVAVNLRVAAATEAGRTARIHGEVAGFVADVDRERDAVARERAAGALDGEPPKVPRNTLGSAGVLMRDAPAPAAVAFLEETYIPEKRLQEDARRHMEGYVWLFGKILGDRSLNTYTRPYVV